MQTSPFRRTKNTVNDFIHCVFILCVYHQRSRTKKHDRQYVCRAFLQQSLFPGSGERLHNGALQFLLHMVVLRNLRQFHHGLPDLIGDVFFFRLSVFLPLDAGAFPQIDFRRDFSALF